jgi:hypothetical protein
MNATYHIPYGRLVEMLERLVSYGCRVEKIERARDGGWMVETAKR